MSGATAVQSVHWAVAAERLRPRTPPGIGGKARAPSTRGWSNDLRAPSQLGGPFAGRPCGPPRRSARMRLIAAPLGQWRGSTQRPATPARTPSPALPHLGLRHAHACVLIDVAVLGSADGLVVFPVALAAE